MKVDNNMSLMQEILAIMPLTQETAMTSAQLFERCKGAETSEHVAKALSASYINQYVDRTKNADNKNVYWLANSIETGPDNPSPFASQEVEIPQFLRKDADSLTVADSIDEKLGADQPIKAFKTAVNQIDISQYETSQPPVAAPFKVAITSAKTLVLEGLSYQPLELTQQQARTLCNFLGEFDAQAYFCIV